MLREKLDGFYEDDSQTFILVIGDVMVDAYMWGNVERISPEAPVPVVACTKRENRLGGAANVALNIKSLGAEPILCSVIGNDAKGQVFIELLENERLSNKGILQKPERKTTVKTRVISQNQHLLRVDEEDTTSLSKELNQHLIDQIKNIWQHYSPKAVVFQDYDKGVITPHLISSITSLANQSKVPVLVDPKKRNFLSYQDATLFKPNFKELKEGLKLEISKQDFEGIVEAARKLIKANGMKMVMVTLSEYGALICDLEKYYHVPAKVRDIVDVSGAGDTVISVAAVCMPLQLDMDLLARVCNLAGGLVCKKSGVVSINLEELLHEVENS